MSLSQLTATQREAFDVLKAAVMGGGVNRQALLDELCDCGGSCDACTVRHGLRTRLHANVHQLHAHESLADLHDPDIKAMTAHVALRTPLRGNARGGDGDRRLLIYDLVSEPNSPYTPDDLDSLRSMTFGTLVTLHQRYVVHANVGGGLHAHAAADPALAAMTHHLTVRRELLTRGLCAREEVRRARDLRKARAKKVGHDAQPWVAGRMPDEEPEEDLSRRRGSPYTPEDEALRTPAKPSRDRAA